MTCFRHQRLQHFVLAVAAAALALGAEDNLLPRAPGAQRGGGGRAATTHPQSATVPTMLRSLGVSYEVIDGWAVHDGDMVLGRIDDIEAGTASANSVKAPPFVRRDVATRGRVSLWPNNIVPYVIPPEFSGSDRKVMLAAIQEWNDRTVLEFVERTTEPDYVKFVPTDDGPCRAHLGFVGGEQYIWGHPSNCAGAWEHEIGHVVGLIHEQQRSDRDNYVMLSRAEIDRSRSSLEATSANHAPYGYRSLMHSSIMHRGFLPTIPPGIGGPTVRPDGVLSPGLIHGVNKLYGKPAKVCTITTNPPGLEIVVDGIRHVTPASFDWSDGSPHRIEAPLWQLSPEQDDGFVFGRWSDNGNRVHNFTFRTGESWIEASYIHLTRSMRKSGRLSEDAHPSPREFDGFDGSTRALTLVSFPNMDAVTDVIRLANHGDAPVQYAIRPERPWLSASSRSASVAPGEGIDLEVTATRAGLPHDLHEGELTITSGQETAKFESLRVTFVVLPEPVSVQLGSSGQSIEVAVSATEGVLGMDGRPLGDRGRVTIANGDTYLLAASANNVVVTLEPQSQAVRLADGSALTAQQHGSMDWRIGSVKIYPGYRHVQGGRESLLELANGWWRSVSHVIRAASIGRVKNSWGLGRIALDEAGSAYIVSDFESRVYKFNVSTRELSVVVGVGGAGFQGDGGPAVEARLNHPEGVAVDAAGNIFVADTYNHRVRRIDGSTGSITTVAGSGPVSEYGGFITGQGGLSGDGGPAVEARLRYPKGVAVDAAGNVYVADATNHRIRKIDASSGVITTLAGLGRPGKVVEGHYVIGSVQGGYSGDGGLATIARLNYPKAVAVDATGNVYVADTYNHRVRRIDASGTISTIAELRYVRDLAVGSTGDIYALAGFRARDAEIWRLDAQGGFIEPITGRGNRLLASDWEPSGGANLNLQGIATDRQGRVWFWDKNSDRLGVMASWPLPGRSAGTGNLVSYSIRSVAGSTAVADGGPASSTTLCYPSGIAVDAVGNVFVADTRNQRIRKVDVSGVVSTLAGTGDWGFSGDGGPSSEAQLYLQYQLFNGLALDAMGNVYLADSGNHKVRKIDAHTAVITTVAGSGRYGFGGDGWPALGARLDSPQGVAVDTRGNLYVADSKNNRVRKIDASTGVITTLAGTGERTSYSAGLGDGGPATEATFHEPSGVAVDATGNLYVADSKNNRVRKIDAFTGVIATLAGTGERTSYSAGLGDGGPATEATFHEPSGVAVDATGNLYVADTYNNRVRKINAASGMITTPTESVFSTRPGGVAVDTAGNVYVADPHRIRKIDAASGVIAPFSGGDDQTCEAAGGLADEARFFSPASIAIDSAGNLFVVDSNRVWKLDATGLVTVLAGTGQRTLGGDPGDGEPATEATFREPTGVAVDTTGNVYVADSEGNRIRKIDSATGVISTLAGKGWGTSYSGENLGDGGPAIEATFRVPIGVAVDATGNVYVADSEGNRIRKIDSATGVISTLAGKGWGTSYNGENLGDGGPAAEATFRVPIGVAVDAPGNLYVADSGNNRVRKINVSTGNIETILVARDISSVAADDSGNVYIGAGNQIRMMDANGDIWVIAGTGGGAFSGDGGSAAGAGLSISAMAVDQFGAVWFADPESRRIRVLEPLTGR